MASATALYGVMVGADHFARYHADAWRRLSGVRIAAICDLDRHRADDVAQRHGIGARFSDWREMIDTQQPDFVDVVSPAHTQREISRYAADRGVHVLCRQPLGVDLDDAAALVAEMADRDVRFMVHAHWRWQPWYRRIRALLDAGAVGEPFSLSFEMRTGETWNADAQLDGPDEPGAHRPLLRALGVQFFDTFRSLLGEVDTVYARTQRRNPLLDGEDTAVVTLGCTGGPIAVLDASRYNDGSAADPALTFGTMRLDGSKGHLQLQADGTVTLHPLGGVPELVDVDVPDTGPSGDSVFAAQRHFVDALTSGAPFETEAADVLPSLRVADAAHRAAELGEVVHLG